MKTLIRPIKESDNAILASIIKQTFIEHNAPKQGTVYSDPTTDDLFKLFSEESSYLWVAEINHQVVGCCGIFPTEGLEKGVCELVKFYIAPEGRGKGMGKQLLFQCEATAIDLGFQKIYIESLPEFAKAVGMYEKAGYKSIIQPLGNSGHSGCSLFMIKDISYKNFIS